MNCFVPRVQHFKVSPRARGFVNPEDDLRSRQKPPLLEKKLPRRHSATLPGPKHSQRCGLNLALQSVSFSHLYHLQHLPGDHLQDAHYVLRVPPHFPSLVHFGSSTPPSGLSFSHPPRMRPGQQWQPHGSIQLRLCLLCGDVLCSLSKRNGNQTLLPPCFSPGPSTLQVPVFSRRLTSVVCSPCLPSVSSPP